MLNREKNHPRKQNTITATEDDFTRCMKCKRWQHTPHLHTLICQKTPGSIPGA